MTTNMVGEQEKTKLAKSALKLLIEAAVDNNALILYMGEIISPSSISINENTALIKVSPSLSYVWLYPSFNCAKANTEDEIQVYIKDVQRHFKIVKQIQW